MSSYLEKRYGRVGGLVSHWVVATMLFTACSDGKEQTVKPHPKAVQSVSPQPAKTGGAVAPATTATKEVVAYRIDPKRESLVSNGMPKAEVAAASIPKSQGRPNVPASFNPDIEAPQLDTAAYVDPLASVIGHVAIGKRTYVAPFASARGDEGQPIHIGSESNLQDGVVVHALETVEHGEPILKNTYEVNGKRYAVFIGDRVSLAHQSQVHGPAWVEDNVFVGMQALVFKAHIGKGSVIEPGAKVIGVTVPAGRYVSAGSVLTDQQVADNLPTITESYPFRALNDAVVHVNTSLADGYAGRGATGEQHKHNPHATAAAQGSTVTEENASHVVAVQ